METRLARKKDIEQIVALWKYMMDYHQKIHEQFARSEEGHKKFKSFVKKQIGSGNAVVMVAEEENEIVGFIVGLIMEFPPVYKLKKKGHINDMVIKKEYQGKGYGGELLSKTLYWYKQVGIERIELDVASGNESANAFYKKHGFEVVMNRMLKKF